MATSNVLIVDDEEKLRNLLKRIIGLEGFSVSEAPNLSQALTILKRNAIDIILCDVKLPDGSGVDFVSEVRLKYPGTPVILLTAFGNIADGVQAMKNGAFDYIVKGDDNDKIIPLLNRADELVALQKKLSRLNNRIGKLHSFESIIGKSDTIRQAIGLAEKVAPTDTTVLLLGETGTGKEVFAQAIHQSSKRSVESFVAINCSAFSRELLESEIFGHKAGAFTGAIKDKKGLIEEAVKGTLFLDEIGEMPLELQTKLLRVLENREFIKVGDTKVVKADVRIIAATNRNLEREVQNGRFREDLFYRLNVFSILLPSLNERRADIPALATYYIKAFSATLNKKISGADAESIRLLKDHNWKGNIRELKNVIERAVILASGTELTVRDLPVDFDKQESHQATGALSAFDLASVEKLHIQRVLIHTGGNKTEAARLLNIGLTTLYRKIEEYNIQVVQ